MKIETQLFGTQQVQREQILHFPAGVIGHEDDHQWMLLADEQQSALAWLQSLSTPQTSLPVISPRRFFADYKVCLDSPSLKPLFLSPQDQLYVLALVSHVQSGLTANLRAPIVLNATRQLGGQMITIDQQPVQRAIHGVGEGIRKSA
jgi:flagellar assembly factor FliW